MTIRSKRPWAVLALVLSATLLAGCAPDAGAGGGSTTAADTFEPGLRGDQGDGGAPVAGGTLSFASYAPVSSLDPVRTQPSGATGGTEMAAIYDLLVRYDAATGRYEPQLARSLEPNADGTSWTLTLRDGLTFSDGTPVNAAAVIASIDRYNAKRGANNEIWSRNVAAVESPNPSTVVFTLAQAWSEFPALLAFGHGMIVAPTADRGDQFVPIGAGPFEVEKFAAQDELVLTPRSDYWGGAPHLSKLKFVSVQGEQPKLDTLASGGIQMAYLRNAETVLAAKDRFPGYADFISMAMIGQINHRPGHPGADVRVRQAMAYAIDPATIDQRARGGQGMPGAELFQSWSRWHNDVAPLPPDQAKARELLEAAKADGYDGVVRYVGVQDPNGEATGLAVQSMLQAVGFDVQLNFVHSPTDMVKRLYVDHDYDVALGGTGLLHAAPFLRLYSTLYSTSTNNSAGVRSPAVDASLDAVMAADSDDAKRAALANVQQVFDDEVPILVWGAGANFVPWQDNVFGVKPSLDSIMLLDKVWIAP
ncbi:ABC transporter substrate-binding protein [Prescottella equi]|uniref:ABC transporter substrate-binding protein n=1 Tax=Rhodococcus hoagii TaxID=43767 RepID=UPI000A0F5B84|nr:ABC transporter substrate-binding protein [Prescottella equi]ORL37006.1 ABC transporter substrate-binding protein [Prescottella equi]